MMKEREKLETGLTCNYQNKKTQAGQKINKNKNKRETKGNKK